MVAQALHPWAPNSGRRHPNEIGAEAWGLGNGDSLLRWWNFYGGKSVRRK